MTLPTVQAIVRHPLRFSDQLESVEERTVIGREALVPSLRTTLVADRTLAALYAIRRDGVPLGMDYQRSLHSGVQFLKEAKKGRELVTGSLLGENPAEAADAFQSVLATLASIYHQKEAAERSAIDQNGLDGFFRIYFNAISNTTRSSEDPDIRLQENDLKLAIEFFLNLRIVALSHSSVSHEIVVGS